MGITSFQGISPVHRSWRTEPKNPGALFATEKEKERKDQHKNYAVEKEKCSLYLTFGGKIFFYNSLPNRRIF